MPIGQKSSPNQRQVFCEFDSRTRADRRADRSAGQTEEHHTPVLHSPLPASSTCPHCPEQDSMPPSSVEMGERKRSQGRQEGMRHKCSPLASKNRQPPEGHPCQVWEGRQHNVVGITGAQLKLPSPSGPQFPPWKTSVMIQIASVH